jgi:hypothetical protein
MFEVDKMGHQKWWFNHKKWLYNAITWGFCGIFESKNGFYPPVNVYS